METINFTILKLIMSLSLIISCAALSGVHSLRQQHQHYQLSMSMFGAQKLGQSIIGTTMNPTTQTTAATSWFRRAPVGSGGDDTAVDDMVDGEESSYKVVSKINLSFKQHSLLMELNNNKWGTTEKLQRIQNAAVDGIISPSTSSISDVSASNLQSGGLMMDWNFDM